MAQTYELGGVPEQFKKEGFKFSTSSGGNYQFKQAGGRLQPVKIEATAKSSNRAQTDAQRAEIARRTAENQSGASSAGTGNPTAEQQAKIAELTAQNRASKTNEPSTKEEPTAPTETPSLPSQNQSGDQSGGSESDAFIQAVEEMKKMREEDKKKQEDLAKRGLQIGGAGTGANVAGMGQQQLLQNQLDMAQQVAGDQAIADQAAYLAQEQARKTNLISTLQATSLGQTLATSGVNLNGLSNAELEGLLKNPNLELTDRIQERITAEGNSALETLAIQRTQLMANNEYQKNQLERDFDRTISDREEFNAQQDNRLRRLAASFGGGKVESMGNNVAIMKEAEKGQKVVENLRGDYIDKKTLLSSQANTVIDTYYNNKRLIEGEMAGLLEDKMAEITNNVDLLMNQGITNVAELQENIAASKRDYMNLYKDVTDKAITLMENETNRVFSEQQRLAEQQYQIEREQQQMAFTTSERIASNAYKTNERIAGQNFDLYQDELNRPQSRFDTGTQASYSSTPTSNTSGMMAVEGGTNSDNCVLFARENVANLPFGLFTKQDKQRAIQMAGESDMSQVQVGDCILTAEGEYGHAAVVKSINYETGELTLKEANYNAGQITEGRTISYDDSNIYGYVRPGMAPAESTGGNDKLEGTNAGIQEQVDNSREALFSVQLDNTAREYLSSGQASKDKILEDVRNSGILGEFFNKLDEIEGTPGRNSVLAVIPKEFRTAVTTKANQFDGEPNVKKFQVTQEGYNFVKSIPSDTTNPSDDQAFLYAFAKIMDPDSVVREGEYATVQKYSQSWAESFGFNSARVFTNTKFLTKESIDNMKKTIESKYKASEKSYDQVRNQYIKSINNLGGKDIGENILQEYKIAQTYEEQNGQYTPEQTTLINNAKKKLSKGNELYYNSETGNMEGLKPSEVNPNIHKKL